MSPGTYIGDGGTEKSESVILNWKQILSREDKKGLYFY